MPGWNRHLFPSDPCNICHERPCHCPPPPNPDEDPAGCPRCHEDPCECPERSVVELDGPMEVEVAHRGPGWFIRVPTLGGPFGGPFKCRADAVRAVVGVFSL